ncbi:MAG: 6-hydroxymethylpterin diphosphokinase MptE-like protein [Candidatus Hydrogenedentota bacterium]
MGLFDKNKLFFKKKFVQPFICSTNKKFKILKTKNGLITLSDNNGNYLHSIYDPIKEAKRKIDSLNIDKDTFVIVIGLGAGYTLVLLKEIVKKVVVIEPFLECITISMNVVDYEDVLSKLHLIFCTDIKNITDVIMNNFDPLLDGKVVTIVNENEFLQDKELLDKIFKDVKYAVDERTTFNIVVSKFGRLWFDNFVKTLKSDKKFFTTSSLPRIKGTGIIIGSGPSLEEDIKEIRDKSKYCYTFVADSALKPCLEQGVDIDFVCSVDPQRKTSTFFKNKKNNEKMPVLLCDTISNADILTFFNNIVLIPSDHPLNLWLANHGYIKGVFINQGGSVVIPLINIVLRIGLEHIILAGIDSGFPFKKVYSRGIYDYNLLNKYNSYIFTQLSRIKTFEVEAVDGTKIKTTYNLDLYRRQIEKIVSENKNNKFYQIYEKSARISNTEFKKISDFSFKKIKERIILKQERILLPYEEIKDYFIEKIKDIEKATNINEIIEDKDTGRIFETLIYEEYMNNKNIEFEVLKNKLKEFIITSF